MSTREQLIEIAELCIRTGGYSSFSFRTIADQLGIKSSSVHYHFPKKEDIGLAVIDNYSEKFRQHLFNEHVEVLSAKDAIIYYINMFLTELTKEKKMCACIVLSAEQTEISENMKTGLKQFYSLNLNWIRHTLKKDSEFNDNKNINGVSNFIFSTLQGALIGAKTLNDSAHFITTIEQLYISVFNETLDSEKLYITQGNSE
ncbi:TetR/AcrR family transcriptional regulator [Marinicellulosiphila megalodicopiae]|uniref:TetR/AcrR family transcriptional regulator n=1 Tax=Marinicellulosiphila megalodicopiae TaxID=2724896 RepID=UPI003BAEDF0B